MKKIIWVLLGLLVGIFVYGIGLIGYVARFIWNGLDFGWHYGDKHFEELIRKIDNKLND